MLSRYRLGSGSSSGQSLVVTALLILVLSLAVFLTFSIGRRVHEKIKMQALADASAYSLAVAEARAFNYYAWSNRAIVAHYVAMLSVNAHDSYLSFYQDLLSRVGANYLMLGKPPSATAPGDPTSGQPGPLWQECNQRPACAWSATACASLVRVNQIAELYFTHADRPWQPNQWVNNGRYLGAEGFAVEFEHKQTTHVTGDTTVSWCPQLLIGLKDHYANRVPQIRFQQLDIETELLWYLSGTPQNRSPVPPPQLFGTDEDLPDPIVGNQKKGVSNAFGGPGTAAEFQYGMADQLAQLVDSKAQTPERDTNLQNGLPNVGGGQYCTGSGKLQCYNAPQSMQTASGIMWTYYANAVNSDPHPHDDYDEILFATRYGAHHPAQPWQTDWLAQRGFVVNAPHWQWFLGQAQALAGGDTTSTTVTEEGNAKAVAFNEGGSTDPGVNTPPAAPVFGNGGGGGALIEFPPFPGPWPYNYSVPSDSFLLTWQGALSPWDQQPIDRDSTWRSGAGLGVANQVHATDFGTSFGMAAEDHGEVTTTYDIHHSDSSCSQPDGKFTVARLVRLGRNTVFSDTGQPAASTTHNHGMHIWSSIPFHEPGHSLFGAYNFGNYPNDVDEFCDSSNMCGLYQGHMQFLYSAGNADIGTQPRTVAMLYKPSQPAAPQPWDFDFTVDLGSKLSFTTEHSVGDQASQVESTGQAMLGAMAGGLVYYHRPTGGGSGGDHDDWKEAPNLWNPFWRAKLHPINESDGLKVLAHDGIPGDDAVANGISSAAHHPFNY